MKSILSPFNILRSTVVLLTLFTICSYTAMAKEKLRIATCQFPVTGNMMDNSNFECDLLCFNIYKREKMKINIFPYPSHFFKGVKGGLY